MVMYPSLRIFAPLISKYSVNSTMEIPTMFTVITRHTARRMEFHRNRGMFPAKKNRITAKGSAFPAASVSRKMDVRVLKHGTTIKPKNR